MDAQGIFEIGSKAGRAYVRAIRQAYRDAKAGDPQSDYYELRHVLSAEAADERARQRLVEREEAEEVAEPMDDVAVQRFLREEAHLDRLGDALHAGGLDAWERELLAKSNAPAPPESQMESDGPDAAKPAPTVESRMACDGPDAADVCPVDDDGEDCGCECIHCYYYGDHDRCASPRGLCAPKLPVPSSSAGRGVGSPGVSAGPEAPSGERTATEAELVAFAAEMISSHRLRDRGGNFARLECKCGDRLDGCNALLEYDHHLAGIVIPAVLRRIDAAVGVTPTPKPAEREAASTFEQHKKAQK